MSDLTAFPCISNQGVTESKRDFLLDVAKGLAIILVVLGHTFQAQNENFDEVVGFRVIYSFHMPFFALLAGASASNWLNAAYSSQSVEVAYSLLFKRLVKSFAYLMVPFFTWTVIKYVLIGWAGGFGGWLWVVFCKPDYSLWFLPCIFWCVTYLVLIELALVKLSSKVALFKFQTKNLSALFIRLLIYIFVWKLFFRHFPNYLGINFANTFHGGLFLWFAVGLLFYEYLSTFKNNLLRLIPYLIFVCLVPFWHRTEADKLLLGFVNILGGSFYIKFYSFIVALSGSMVVLDIARRVMRLEFKVINIGLASLGAASLAIYAIHFYFLDFYPLVLVPILLSFFMYMMLRRIPLVGFLLFGKNSRELHLNQNGS